MLLAERDNNTVNQEFHDEITNLHKAKREHETKLDQVVDKLVDLDVRIYEMKEDANKNKKNIIENGTINSEVIGRIEDINQLNSKVTKKFDEVQFAINGIDKDLEEIERRRVNGENEIK